jgi:hypothetical protein
VTLLREGTDAYYNQLLSLAVLTEPNRHPLTPEYGIFDPVFRAVDKGQFVVQAARYVPEVVITNIDVDLSETEDVNVSIGFVERD